jgi:hypothetical protein
LIKVDEIPPWGYGENGSNSNIGGMGVAFGPRYLLILRRP